MEKFNIEINKNIIVTAEDIDDIMCSALEGGITYWCDEAEVVGDYLGEFASEQISKGGKLLLHDAEDMDEVYELTREKLLDGIKRAIAEQYYEDYGWVDGNRLDCCQIDAEVADCIVQLALFHDIVFG